MGHLFFLFAMVVLIFTIRGKALDKVKGWRLIQYAAFCFILWNLDTLTAHFLDKTLNRPGETKEKPGFTGQARISRITW